MAVCLPSALQHGRGATGAGAILSTQTHRCCPQGTWRHPRGTGRRCPQGTGGGRETGGRVLLGRRSRGQSAEFCCNATCTAGTSDSCRLIGRRPCHLYMVTDRGFMQDSFTARWGEGSEACPPEIFRCMCLEVGSGGFWQRLVCRRALCITCMYNITEMLSLICVRGGILDWGALRATPLDMKQRGRLWFRPCRVCCVCSSRGRWAGVCSTWPTDTN